MKTSQRLIAFTLSTGLLLSAGAAVAQYAPPPPPPPGYQGGWDAPPNEFQDEAHRNGFHDGIEGARKDYENHRAPNVNNRDEFRHPHVPGPLRHAYREGFRRGYDVAVQHFMGGPGPRPGPPPPPQLVLSMSNAREKARSDADRAFLCFP